MYKGKGASRRPCRGGAYSAESALRPWAMGHGPPSAHQAVPCAGRACWGVPSLARPCMHVGVHHAGPRHTLGPASWCRWLAAERAGARLRRGQVEGAGAGHRRPHAGRGGHGVVHALPLHPAAHGGAVRVRDPRVHARAHMHACTHTSMAPWQGPRWWACQAGHESCCMCACMRACMQLALQAPLGIQSATPQCTAPACMGTTRPGHPGYAANKSA